METVPRRLPQLQVEHGETLRPPPAAPPPSERGESERVTPTCRVLSGGAQTGGGGDAGSVVSRGTDSPAVAGPSSETLPEPSQGKSDTDQSDGPARCHGLGLKHSELAHLQHPSADGVQGLGGRIRTLV